MATITIPWTTGTGNIYLTYTAASGNQTIQVSSDPNTLYSSRQQSITFTSSVSPYPTATLTVTQSPKIGDFDGSFDLSFTINT